MSHVELHALGGLSSAIDSRTEGQSREVFAARDLDALLRHGASRDRLGQLVVGAGGKLDNEDRRLVALQAREFLGERKALGRHQRQPAAGDGHRLGRSADARQQAQSKGNQSRDDLHSSTLSARGPPSA
jgi:hypothetical protein